MNARNKIVGRRQLKTIVHRLKKQGRTIAFTNGCFDLLHVGHTTYLEKAKAGKRVLIVGINSDRSVREIKGPGRPIVPQRQRALVLAALASVDYVSIFDEETPLNLIELLKPDVLIKGADWKGKDVVGSRVVNDNKGRVEFIAYVKGSSTTNLVKRIEKACP